jgi:hypothetical protein
LYSWLSLAVNAAGQTKATKFLVVDLAFTKLSNLLFEIEDILLYNRIF